MTKLNHPKLTLHAVNHFLHIYKRSPEDAKHWLSNLLNVKKSQRNEWVKRILSQDFSTPQVTPQVVTQQKKIRRLFWDIETSPNIVLSWRIGYKINISHDNILSERKIICIGYKWEGEENVTVLHWDENQDDKAMLVKFLAIANEADELIAHNGDSFDMPWFKTRCIFHGLNTLPDYKTVDTLQWARRKFLFNSNKMDYIAKYLGFGGKIHTEFNLWKDIVLNKCPKAMELMVKYCAKDVILLEKVWAKLRLLVQPKTHAGVKNGKAKFTCVHCGSDHIHKSKTIITARGTINHQMKCITCNGYSTINDAEYQNFVAAKKTIYALNRQ